MFIFSGPKFPATIACRKNRDLWDEPGGIVEAAEAIAHCLMCPSRTQCRSVANQETNKADLEGMVWGSHWYVAAHKRKAAETLAAEMIRKAQAEAAA